MRRKLVIVGAGMASGRMLERLFKVQPDAYDVTLFGAEPRGNYNRIMLSPVLAGEATFDETVIHDAPWYAAHGVVCRFGETITKIDRTAKTVHSRNGKTPYDRLVIATGSAPFVIPVAGKELQGVLSFRDFDDVNAMLAVAARPGMKVVVLGGGLLGLEAAAGLQARGMSVAVLHLMGHLMERQLDPAAGRLLQRALEARGIDVHCNAQTTAILGHKRAEAVLLDDGTIYPADLVVMATGIRPETRIATDAGLDVERGIVVDDRMRTSDPNIYAVGECVEHAGICYGLVEPIYDMAAVVARTLAGDKAAFRPAQFATNLKVTGVNVFSAGDFLGAADTEQLVLSDPGLGTYKKLVIKGGRLVGAVLFGDSADGLWYLDLIRSGVSIEAFRQDLVFGRAFVSAAA
ncbi:MAG: NAD(P)/FAD-dependent oxidoreductase [Rhizobiales bacterium]|nr:NAD(P)/FAD-dependent oxidoreductase [Hyphomicrobiales bacterium]